MSMSDHQDSEHFAYNRTWDEIEDMLDKAERKLNYHQMEMSKFAKLKGRNKPHPKWVEHARNFKALQGGPLWAYNAAGETTPAPTTSRLRRAILS